MPSTCHREAHEPSSRARGWEQLATGGPLNKGRFEQSVSLFRALWPADPLGMPRPTPSLAYRVPRGGGTAGPGACGPGCTLWGPQSPAGTPPGTEQGRPAGPAGLWEEGETFALVIRTPGSSRRPGLAATSTRPPGLQARSLPGF